MKLRLGGWKPRQLNYYPHKSELLNNYLIQSKKHIGTWAFGITQPLRRENKSKLGESRKGSIENTPDYSKETNQLPLEQIGC